MNWDFFINVKSKAWPCFLRVPASRREWNSIPSRQSSTSFATCVLCVRQPKLSTWYIIGHTRSFYSFCCDSSVTNVWGHVFHRSGNLWTKLFVATITIYQDWAYFTMLRSSNQSLNKIIGVFFVATFKIKPICFQVLFHFKPKIVPFEGL